MPVIDPTDTDLREWVAQGMGAQRIALVTGQSVWTIRKRLGALGLRAKRGGHKAGPRRGTTLGIRLSADEMLAVETRGGSTWARGAILAALNDPGHGYDRDMPCPMCDADPCVCP